MTHPAELPPEPEPLPRNVAAEKPSSSFVAQAVYEVAYKLGGADLAARITSHYTFDHERALEMLEIADKNARSMVKARFAELVEFADSQVLSTRKKGASVLKIFRWPF